MQQLPTPYANPQFYPAHPIPVTPFPQVNSAYPCPLYAPTHPAPNHVIAPTGAPVSKNTPPSSEIASSRLTTGQGIQVGLKSGMLFSLIAGGPIWLIEKARNETSLILQMTAAFEGMKKQFLGSTTMPLTKHIAGWHPALQSVSSTALVGLIAGAGLGGWIVSNTKKKLLEINQMKQDQQQGVFQPKPLSLMQKLGAQPASSNDPDQRYQDLLQTNLSTSHAFKQGASTVFTAKVLPSILLMGTLIGGLFYMRSKGSAQVKAALAKAVKENPNSSPEALTKMLFHPVMLAKMAAFPIMGGFIAQQTVPWMRRQLGIQQ